MKQQDIFKEYVRIYENYDKCIACIEDIALIAHKQNNYEIGQRIEKLLNELKKIENKENFEG